MFSYSLRSSALMMQAACHSGADIRWLTVRIRSALTSLASLLFSLATSFRTAPLSLPRWHFDPLWKTRVIRCSSQTSAVGPHSADLVHLSRDNILPFFVQAMICWNVAYRSLLLFDGLNGVEGRRRTSTRMPGETSERCTREFCVHKLLLRCPPHPSLYPCSPTRTNIQSTCDATCDLL